MSACVFDSSLYGRLFSSSALAAQFDDREQLRAMLRVEAALAIAEARSGLIPVDAAERIALAVDTLDPDPAALAAGTESSGVPVGPLVALLREAVGSEAAAWVHWGATSQDIVDTGLLVRLREVIRLIDERLENLIRAFLDLARRHGDTPMIARTRSQAAVPTSFGLKAAGWAAPLMRHRERLKELKPRLLVVQLGGAAGTRSVFGDAGVKVVAELGRELGLGKAPLPWHAQRDAIVELAGWLSLVTGSTAKLGQDIVLLAQTEVGEVRIDSGGGSSTMPQKSNPVAAELLVALGRHNAALVGEMHQALIHGHERDGAAWSSEWIALPQMAVASAAALERASNLVDALTVDKERMAANLAALNGLVLAEAAVFALARHMPRAEAEKLVRDAARATQDEGGHLLDRLAQSTDARVDWQALNNPLTQIKSARAILDEFLSGHQHSHGAMGGNGVRLD